MAKAQSRVLLFCSLLTFWLLLNGSLAVDVIFVGIAVSLLLTMGFAGDLAFIAEFRATPQAFLAAIRYAGYFLIELVKANLSVARIVLSPALPLNPGIVKARTRLKSPVGRLLLANSITLTPGTLTVELDGEWLYVHWVTVDGTDIEAATASIVAGFEHYLEVMYG